MTSVSIDTFEDIHHVCLMYGLKQAFRRFPFLAHNIMATPPPLRRNPERPALLIGCRTNPVSVQYYRKAMQVIYNEEKVSIREAQEFSKAVMEEYLHLRHPFMKHQWSDNRLLEISTGHLLAEII